MKKILCIGVLLVLTLTGCDDKLTTKPNVIKENGHFEVMNVEESECTFDNHYDALIYTATKDTVVDPFLAIAISRLETGHYTSDAFLNGYNFGGITTSNGVKSFDSLDDGLTSYIRLLEWYYDNGMNTPVKMQETYCPPNDNWDDVVSEIMEGLTYEHSRSL